MMRSPPPPLQILMHIRLGAHVLVALFLGILFSNLGDTAANVYRNVGALFFSILFVVYGAMMPTVITCGFPRALFPCVVRL